MPRSTDYLRYLDWLDTLSEDADRNDEFHVLIEAATQDKGLSMLRLRSVAGEGAAIGVRPEGSVLLQTRGRRDA